MKKRSEYKRFMALSDAQKDAEVAKFDRELSIDHLRPLSRADRLVLARAARRKRGRPRIGQGAKRVLLSIEGGLLAEADSTARKLRISRSELVSRGLRAAIALAG